MRTKSRSRIACLAIAGMFAAGVFMAGCSMGSGPGTSIAGEAGAPTVPFSFTAGGRGSAGGQMANQNTGKFDAVAPQTGAIDTNFVFDEDTAISLGTVGCAADHSSGGRCYTTDSEELVGGTAGHSIEITFTYLNSIPGLTDDAAIIGLASETPDADHTGRYIACAVTSGSDAYASCPGFIPGNDISHNDFAALRFTWREMFSTTGTGTQHALRFAVWVDTDGDGNSTFSAADGTFNFDPSASSSSNLTEDASIVATDTDLSPDFFGDQNAAMAFDVADPAASMDVDNSTDFSLPLAVTDQSYTGLNVVALNCSEHYCPDPGPDGTMSYFRSVGSKVAALGAGELGKLVMTTAKQAVMSVKNGAIKTVMAKEYNALTGAWATKTVTSAEIKEVAMAKDGSYAMYTKAADSTAVLMKYSSDTSTYEEIAAITVPIEMISLNLDSTGVVYVGYKDTVTSKAMIISGSYDVNSVWAWSGPVDVTTALGGYASLNSISAVDVVDSFNGSYAIMGVCYSDVSNVPYTAVVKSDGASYAFTVGDTVQALVSKLSVMAVGYNNNNLVAVAAFADETGALKLKGLTYLNESYAWADLGDLAGLTVTDGANSVTSVAYDSLSGTISTVGVDVNGYTYYVTYDPSLESTTKTIVTANVAAYATVTVISGDFSEEIVTYLDATKNEVVAKEKGGGLRKAVVIPN